MWWRAKVSLLGRVVRTSLAVVPRQRLAYSWCEVRGGGSARTWLLKETRRPITVRCGTRDRDILYEIFIDRAYVPPPEVDEILNLRENPRVVDLGANIGLFGIWVLSRWPGARLHSFEPDPDNLVILEHNVAVAGVGSRWSVTRACAAPAAATVQFLTGRQADSRTVYDAEPLSDLPEVSAVDVFPHLQDADLLKIDIEGGEWPLLTDTRFRDLSVPLPNPQRAARVLDGCSSAAATWCGRPTAPGPGWARSGRGGHRF
jgi:FkbM family methyltransferase